MRSYICKVTYLEGKYTLSYKIMIHNKLRE